MSKSKKIELMVKAGALTDEQAAVAKKKLGEGQVIKSTDAKSIDTCPCLASHGNGRDARSELYDRSAGVSPWESSESTIARREGDHGLPAAFIASAYFSSRPYLDAQVVYMKPTMPRTSLAAESQPWKFDRSSAS